MGEEKDPAEVVGSRPDKEASPRKSTSLLRKSWRPLLLCIIAAVTGIYGVHYKRLATPDTAGDPLIQHVTSLDVFCSNPRMSVELTDIATNDAVSAVSNVSIRVQVPPNTVRPSIFILSSAHIPGLPRLQLLSQSGSNLEVAPAGQHSSSPEYGGTFTLSGGKPGQRDVTFQLRPFQIGPDVFESNDATYASLPNIGFEDYGINMVPAALYTRGYGALFFAPRKLFITESLQEAFPILQSEPIKQITPGGALVGSDYVWHDTGVLEPTFETTYETGVTQENNAAFLSGILFGLAGAAVIALIQEFPESLPGRWFPTFKKRRRRRSSSG
jgi:hypothetical protein